MNKKTYLLLSIMLLSVLSCQNNQGDLDEGEGRERPLESAFPGAEYLEAMVIPGPNPLWFEVSPQGPHLIDSPGDASLQPYEAWPFSRFIPAIIPRGKFLVMPVNTLGLVVWEDRDDEGALYFRGVEEWKDYCLGAAFRYQGKPAVLLYRNDFFTDSGKALPQDRVSLFDPGSFRVEWPSLGLWAEQRAEEHWDIEALRQGRDGIWYYRGLQKKGDAGETAYFKAANLEEAGTKIEFGVFKNGLLPYTIENAVEPLRSALKAAESKASPAGMVCTVYSEDFEDPRYYQSSQVLGENFADTRACHRSGEEARALVLFPDGSGIIARMGEEGKAETRAVTLPYPGEGFVFTGTALSGKVLITTWEEQQDSAVGAAGFMVMTLPEM